MRKGISVSLLALAFTFAALQPCPAAYDYGAGLSAVKKYIAAGDLPRAESLLRQMDLQYRRNPEILSMLASVLYWQKKYDDSLAIYQDLLERSGDQQLRADSERVFIARLINEVDSSIADGEIRKAIPVLQILFDSGKSLYDAGYRLGKLYLKERDFDSAAVVFQRLTSLFPADAEFSRMLAHIYLWQNRYDASIDVYDTLLALPLDEAVRTEVESDLREAVLARLLSGIDILIARGDYEKPHRVLRFMFDAGIERYGSGYRLGMLCIKERNPGEAVGIFSELTTLYPEDTGFLELYIEALIMKGEIEKASGILNTLPENKRQLISKDRDDLFYRVRKNYVRISAEYDAFSGRLPAGRNLSVDLSQRVHDFTAVLGSSVVRRYGLQDSQFRLALYSNVGEKTRDWGYVSFSYSQDARFLPETTFGAEINHGFGNAELSLGYNRMNFRDAAVDIIIPGITVYLPYTLSLNERVYLVPKYNTRSFLTTLNYEPDHRFRAYNSVAIGNSSERISSLNDLIRVSTVSDRLGLEYRTDRASGIGMELLYEHRSGFYQGLGISVFTRYWW